MGKKQKSLWLGFLEAGSKRSPIVRDSSLETGSQKTVYLFNLMKGRILEYRRDIVEPKLRELSDEELAEAASLKEAFEQARAGFTPRAKHRDQPMPRRRSKLPEPEEPDLDVEEIRPYLEDETFAPLFAEEPA